MRHFGLIGRKLGHSWSAEYFARKFAEEQIEADYRLIELHEICDVQNLTLDGYNVTIPYKTAILPYLQALDPIAKIIGAVNVVKNGKGYNTDWIGFKQSLSDILTKHHTVVSNALILGRGGAAKAVKYALEQMNIAAEMMSARGKIAANIRQYELIVNATPLGMSPDVNTYPDMDYPALTDKHILFDCVYNPEETEFLRRGKAQGATTVNGRRMLEIQAEESWKIWNN